MAKKNIESFEVVVSSQDNYSFEDILTSDSVVEREFLIRGKHVELALLENNSIYIVGILKTSRRDNIPPKTNRVTKAVGNIGLTEDEGLGYANIFIYEKKRNILMYEVNNKGCNIGHFIEYLYKCRETENCELNEFAIVCKTILGKASYERILAMETYKTFEFQIANPSEMLDAYEHKNDAIYATMASANSIHSDKAAAKFMVDFRGRGKFENKGLLNTSVGVLLQRFRDLMLGKFSKNIKLVKVTGYEDDSEDNRLLPIDLVTDRYIKQIQLREPRENVDLLQEQRKKEIKELYNKCKQDFDHMFKVH